MKKTKEQLYNIVRFRTSKDYSKVTRKVTLKGLTLEQAQAHCQRKDTQDIRWFDGYEKA